MADPDVPVRKLVVLGQGYVGLPLSMRAVEVGYHVVGFDVDQAKIDQLLLGWSYIDDVTSADIAAALGTGRYMPSSDAGDLRGFDLAVITVPTPLHHGAPDLRFIESAGRTLAPHVRPGCVVVLESTTYPGTTEEILAPILRAGSGLEAGIDFHLGFSPERIDPGNQRFTFRTTPKIVSGTTPAGLSAVQAFYDDLVDHTVALSGTREAELAKLLENTFRHVNIALINELAMHCHMLGIDIWEVIRGAATKPFGFMPFTPGPGVGGHCLPVDPSYLSWKVARHAGESSRFIDTANDINNHMPDYVAQRVLLGLNARAKPMKGSRVLVLGLAYKKNSNDARETPAVAVIEALCDLGAAVVVHDDHVADHPIDDTTPRVALSNAELEAADVVVIVTDHDDVDYDRVVARAAYVFDTRHRVRGANVETL